ncbi:hydantoinase/carbamoylase family amidase [Variovorax paradoxus]|uniref:hydantoinase/carbamoylase family amidase n=1 Tax=Variovorax paradoxus TaxID=34073 RepID=UPI0029C67B26|nr:hydantoinase/carbamoylase family amidase [Variovorax paradoxus]
MNVPCLQSIAETLFSDVRDLSFDGIGVTRESYGRGESATAEYLREFAKQQGLDVHADRAANLVFRLPGSGASPAVSWTGSHIDSVPQGGNFDGYAGVVAGLLCLLEQKRSGTRYRRPLEVVAFRGEESAWFGKAYMGSGALFGKISTADLDLKQRTTGQTMADCMLACGADIEAIRTQQVLIDKSRVKAYLELHIEQGPVMVARQLPLAVVSGIRGNVRHNRVVCHGDAQHSGVVPRWLRHDAMFAVADLIMRIDEHWRVLLERGTDLVVTTGIVTTDPAEHSVSRIPGHVSFSLEARSKNIDTLEAFYQLMRTECTAIERERGVRFEFDRRLLSDPATMDTSICDVLSKACSAQGTRFEVIPSGAGHDASLFANAGIPSGMLFVRNQNGSHNPHEAMDMGDFMLGMRAMHSAFAQLA